MASYTQQIIAQTTALNGLAKAMGAVVAVADQMQRSARQGSGLTGGAKIQMGSIGAKGSGPGSSGPNNRVAFSSLGF